MSEEKGKKKSSFISVVGSILAAAVGVQSNKNREKDFENQTIMPYIIGGVVFTVIFIATLVGVANIFLANS